MPQPDLTPLNLASMSRGAAFELFEKCLNEIVKNIADTDTPAESSRGIALTFKFKPESDRRTVHVTVSAKTSLVGAADHCSKVFLGKTTDGSMLVFDQDPRQDVLFEAPKQTDNLLDFTANGGA